MEMSSFQKMWEYNTFVVYNSSQANAVANDAGLNGWEMVSVCYSVPTSTYVMFFKREKKDE